MAAVHDSVGWLLCRFVLPGLAAAITGVGAVWCGTCARAEAPDYTRDVRPLLEKYCFDCHTGAEANSGVALEARRPEEANAGDRVLWLKVLRQVQGGVMPPADAAQPTAEERGLVDRWIREAALRPDCSRGERPGRVTLRRLNRAEYDNTIRDLLGVDIKAAAELFPSDDVGYGFDSIGDVLSMPPVLFERALQAAERVAQATIATGEVETAPVRVTKGGTLPSVGEIGEAIPFAGAGDYIIRVQAWGDQAGDEPVKMALRLDGTDLETFEVRATARKPRDYEVQHRVEGGEHRVAAAFLNDYFNPEAPDPRRRDRNLHVDAITVIGPIGVLPDPLPEPHLRFFSRPVDPAADRAEQQRQAREVLRPVVSRAYRRPATETELDRLLAVYDTARDQGESIQRSMQVALAAVLVSPSFLYRVEQDPPAGQVRDLDDFELATRLSYFLWSSMPDRELLGAALRKELHTPEQLVAHATRMLRDDKARALVDNFAGQWLQLRSLETFAPDRGRFPGFDDDLRRSMRRETEEFFARIVREDRSIIEFLDADWSVVDERLARHYGMEGVSGSEFRQVAVDRGTRGGLLGQASILAVTSNPTRTSPVKRGKWILENLFAAPPPPPPPNVPELTDAGAQLTGTLRQRMEQHRADPGCAGCHRLMDPLGFGLENYDAIGHWRTEDGGAAVDAGGETPDGSRFNGPAELRGILLLRRDEFRRCLAEKLLTYALGRGLEWYDACAVERIASATAAGGDRFSVLVAEIVKSPAFRQREAAESR
jgi:hypothetical protein